MSLAPVDGLLPAPPPPLSATQRTYGTLLADHALLQAWDSRIGWGSSNRARNDVTGIPSEAENFITQPSS